MSNADFIVYDFTMQALNVGVKLVLLSLETVHCSTLEIMLFVAQYVSDHLQHPKAVGRHTELGVSNAPAA